MTWLLIIGILALIAALLLGLHWLAENEQLGERDTVERSRPHGNVDVRPKPTEEDEEPDNIVRLSTR